MKTNDAKTSKYGENYSINQCSFMIRVDDQEVEVPLNFGMTSDEIKRLYPFILQFASIPVKNPTVEFTNNDESGMYMDMSEKERDELRNKVNAQSRYWYGKSEASVLDIAIRFALDIQLRGIAELSDLFAPVSPLDILDKQDVAPMTSEEAEEYIQEMGLETDVDREHDPGDEQDIDYSAAQGDVHINMYEPGDDEDDFISSELAAMEAKLGVEDKFEQTISDDINKAGGADKYKVTRNPDDTRIEGGLLSMYGTDEDASSNIFDTMDAEDGLVMDETTDLNDTVPQESSIENFSEEPEFASEPEDSPEDDDYDWDAEDNDYDENGED